MIDKRVKVLLLKITAYRSNILSTLHHVLSASRFKLWSSKTLCARIVETEYKPISVMVAAADRETHQKVNHFHWKLRA